MRNDTTITTIIIITFITNYIKTYNQYVLYYKLLLDLPQKFDHDRELESSITFAIGKLYGMRQTAKGSQYSYLTVSILIRGLLKLLPKSRRMLPAFENPMPLFHFPFIPVSLFYKQGWI